MDIKGALHKYSTPAMLGVLKVSAPSVAKGVIKSYIGNIKARQAMDYVANDETLWYHIGPEYHQTLKRIASGVGDLKWLNVAWVIDSIKGQNPGLASLFMGDEQAADWLRRQLDLIKKELTS